MTGQTGETAEAVDGDTTDWVDEQTPDATELYTHLKNAFNKLSSNTDNIPHTDDRSKEAIDSAARDLRFAEPENWTLEIEPHLVFKLQEERDFAEGNGEARIGGNIRVEEGEFEMFSCDLIFAAEHPIDNDSLLSDSLDHCCIHSSEDAFEETEEDIRDRYYHILERIHWDIDTGSEEDEDKPICHVQIGGKKPEKAFRSGEQSHYCSSGLDKPRIPHPPMDPTLVFNMLVSQYESLESFQQNDWDGVIKKVEKGLWNPYFNATHGMASKDDMIMELLQPN